MNTRFPEDLKERLYRDGVIAVVIVDDPARAVKLARALLKGGVSIMELTLRTDAALNCLRAIIQEVPEMVVGAGTVLFPEQVDQVVNAGATFGVSPGVNSDILRHAGNRKLPFAPGVMTPSDIDLAVQHHCRVLKFFPAESSGGTAMLESISAPFAHLGLSYIPLGGITAATLPQWLTATGVLAVGGSWLARKAMIEGEKWDEIARTAEEATSIVRAVRG